MMTWITAKSLFDSAASLDTPQLALAYSEGESMFNELIWGEPNEPHGPMPTPLRNMWSGYEVALAAYVVACGATLVAHGVSTGVRSLAIADTVAQLRAGEESGAPLVLPPWFEDVDIMRSHRSNLMRRWPSAYSWNRTPNDLPYIWPVIDEGVEGGYKLVLSKHDKDLIARGERSIPKPLRDRISNA